MKLLKQILLEKKTVASAVNDEIKRNIIFIFFKLDYVV